MMKKLFEEIFEDRKKEDEEGAEYVECQAEDCPVCFVSGKRGRIYKQDIAVHNFRHLVGKNVAPELKYDKSNVQICHYAAHALDHQSGNCHDELGLK